MKKGKKYSAKRIRIYTFLRSGLFYALLAFAATFAVSVLGLAANIYFYAVHSEAKTLADMLLSLAATFITGFGTYKSSKNLTYAFKYRRIVTPDSIKKEINDNIPTNMTPSYYKNGYVWNKFNDEYYLGSDLVDDFLRDNAEKLTLKIYSKKSRMSEDQKWTIFHVVNKKIRHGKHIFNSNLVKLRSDIFCDDLLKDSDVIVQKTDYFYNITSNDLIYSRILDGDYSKKFDGKVMTADGSKFLYNLADSPAANIIGATTLAITSDGYAIINVQNTHNDINNGCLVPSGSGSADFDDLKEFKIKKVDSKEAKQSKKARKKAGIKKVDLKEAIHKKKARKKAEIKAAREEFKKAKQYYKTTRKKFKGEFKNAVEVLERDDNAKISADVTTCIKAEALKSYEKAAKDYLQNREHYRYMKKMRKYELGFKPFLTKAMERELSEESHIPANNIIKTEICGYIRILERGGKPDFFGITFLSCTKEEAEKLFIVKKTKVVYEKIQKNSDIMDFDEVYCQHYVPVAELFNKKTIAELSQNNPVSLQLHCLEKILLRNKQLLIDNGINID